MIKYYAFQSAATSTRPGAKVAVTMWPRKIGNVKKITSTIKSTIDLKAVLFVLFFSVIMRRNIFFIFVSYFR